MKLTLMLADAAQLDAQLKLYVLGANWTHTSTPTPPMSLIVVADLDPSELPAAIALTAELVDEAGNQVELASPPDGALKPVLVEGVGTATPLPPHREGEPVRVQFVANLGPGMPLEPGKYAFRVQVSQADGDSHSDQIHFRVRPLNEPV